MFNKRNSSKTIRHNVSCREIFDIGSRNNGSSTELCNLTFWIAQKLAILVRLSFVMGENQDLKSQLEELPKYKIA